MRLSLFRPRAESLRLPALSAVLLLGSILYLGALGKAPIHISSDEARFGTQAQSIATTGRDLTGTRTPLFFHITNPLTPPESSLRWWQPLLFYLIAGVLWLVPISEWSVRLPIASLAILDIFLIHAVARRLFLKPWYALAAAVMLVLNPAHFIFGRQALDYFCPQSFVLAWLWCLLTCVRTESAWLPAVTGALLGAGLYSYITSWVVMPCYLAVSAIVLLRSGKPIRDVIRLAAGFTVMLLPLIPWLLFHPSMPRDLLAHYQVASSFRLVERLDIYWTYFSPSYLFFSGGSNPMFATRNAGVFLLAGIVLLPCGIWSLSKQGSWAALVLVFGFLFAPVPIVAAIPEDPTYFTPRALLAVPFGVLISVAGLEWLVDRGRTGRLAAALLLLSLPLQFASFARDYFTDYQIWAAYRFDDMNLRDVAERVIAADVSSRVPAVYLSDEMGEHKVVQWKFHVLTFQRPDLWERTSYSAVDPCQAEAVPTGSLVVLYANDHRVEEWQQRSRCSLMTIVRQVSGQPAAAIFRRN